MIICRTHPDEFDVLTDLWEDSVRATHDFLTESDIAFLRPKIRHEFLGSVDLRVYKNDEGKIIGFIGVADNKIEMLFIAPQSRGQGIGTALLRHAIEDMNATMVDVNEQNPQALGFYQHHGFEVISKSAVDGLGLPFPLLHMALATVL